VCGSFAPCHTPAVGIGEGQEPAFSDDQAEASESLLHRLEQGVLPPWLRPAIGEHRLPVVIAILVSAGLQLALPPRFSLSRPHWLIPALEIVLLASLTVINPVRLTRHTPAGRWLSLLLVAVISFDNGGSALLLDAKLIRGSAGQNAGPLLASAAAIYLTNVIAFGIWYWQLDRGGPFARAQAISPYPDFLFPQMTQHHLARNDWRPQFGDYLY
jgi:hypothetical protein